MPRDRSCSAVIARIWCASSTIALAPLPGSRPACAGMPCTSSSNSPQPFRLVFAAPPGSDGSSTSTAWLRRASSSIIARDVPLPTSSSVVHNITSLPLAGRAVLVQCARAASIAIAMPDFMSKTPGPCRRPSRSTSGIRSICPTGQTVSKWPRTSTCRSPSPNSARTWSPQSHCGRRSTRPPIAASRRSSSAPHRSTAALSSLGDSSAHQRTDRFEQPRALRFAELEDGVHGSRESRVTRHNSSEGAARAAPSDKVTCD